MSVWCWLLGHVYPIRWRYNNRGLRSVEVLNRCERCGNEDAMDYADGLRS